MKMMKSLLLFGVFFASLSLFAAELVGKVTRVSDGDTVWVTDASGKKEKIRLDRIDAPESQQEYGSEATKALTRLVGNQKVRVEYEKRDQYGRILGIIYATTNGVANVDINLVMVATGNAWHYSYFDKTKAYADAEKAAREAKRGLWSKPRPVNPYEFRKKRNEIGKETAANTPAEKVESEKEQMCGFAQYEQEQMDAWNRGERIEYNPGGAMPVSKRQAAPVCIPWPETGYWLNTNSNIRHNKKCPNYRKTRGYPCFEEDGKPCKICGG